MWLSWIFPGIQVSFYFGCTRKERVVNGMQAFAFKTQHLWHSRKETQCGIIRIPRFLSFTFFLALFTRSFFPRASSLLPTSRFCSFRMCMPLSAPFPSYDVAIITSICSYCISDFSSSRHSMSKPNVHLRTAFAALLTFASVTLSA